MQEAIIGKALPVLCAFSGVCARGAKQWDGIRAFILSQLAACPLAFCVGSFAGELGMSASFSGLACFWLGWTGAAGLGARIGKKVEAMLEESEKGQSGGAHASQ